MRVYMYVCMSKSVWLCIGLSLCAWMSLLLPFFGIGCLPLFLFFVIVVVVVVFLFFFSLVLAVCCLPRVCRAFGDFYVWKLIHFKWESASICVAVFVKHTPFAVVWVYWMDIVVSLSVICTNRIQRQIRTDVHSCVWSNFTTDTAAATYPPLSRALLLFRSPSLIHGCADQSMYICIICCCCRCRCCRCLPPIYRSFVLFCFGTVCLTAEYLLLLLWFLFDSIPTPCSFHIQAACVVHVEYRQQWIQCFEFDLVNCWLHAKQHRMLYGRIIFYCLIFWFLVPVHRYAKRMEYWNRFTVETQTK